ncbi:MAG TPA: hypothetical protein VHU41_20475, partial [Thermoanaerobaculia bacterium]|nr:hypothetical protein [Thermoanaerobaculia bacterium]
MIDGDDCGLRETIAKWPFVERVDDETEENAFDVVVACHVGPAESRPLHVIERAMKPEGVMLVNDEVSLPLGDDVVEMI